MKHYYYATTESRLSDVLQYGIRPNKEGFVVLVDNQDEAVRTAYQEHGDAVVYALQIAISKDDEANLTEAESNNADVRYYGYAGAIGPDKIKNAFKYDFQNPTETPADFDKPFYTVQEAADLLQVHENTIYNMLRRGEIEHYKVGVQIRISAAELARLKVERKSN